ncbi:exodeoxyribonuclease VII small subunit [Alteromonas sp. a30]|uniref:exodeoxyribonuclease VII small subunit n=1 Tax=Alteromonas sp. a30 TaxID=2730917 RepID=UPI00227F1D74|nr:exodeoxyribonuclease VII small subunit [Alteromonas sp. a30]MCY7296591.1 exodeoxyribonuclease VII small subunit [Alteromonas sp. a30]
MTQQEKPENLSFEQAIEELEQIVSTMEQGDLPLEQALGAFERGVQLANQSQQKLKQAEHKVKVLLEKSGEQALVDFENEQEQHKDLF